MVLEPEIVSVEEGAGSIWGAGAIKIFERQKTAFFCSSQCPGSVILKTFDVITAWRDEGRIVAGGFHSPMEQECLGILLRGRQPIIWMPARSIAGMHLKRDLQPAFADGRLLILSPFQSRQKRITSALAEHRNDSLAKIVEDIFIAHAAPGGRTMQLCQNLARKNKPLLTIEDPTNRPLLDLGAKPVILRSSEILSAPGSL